MVRVTGPTLEGPRAYDEDVPTLLLSFDNLGEASDLERGTWDANVPLGQHPSVTVALPRLLTELARLELHATFFVEAINCEINPDAVLQIARRGHELGVHGWRHEPWGALNPEDERALLNDAVTAFAALGLRPRGFRPPGGALTEHSVELLSEFGFRWYSPQGEADTVIGNVMPFLWEMVDAYYLMERFAPLRVEHGDAAESLEAGPAALRIETGLMDGPQRRVLILHPFLMLDDAWWAQTRRLLRLIAETARLGRLTVGSGKELGL
jgi:peptidoglycan/xylan/chitin deacetylase (PgdA/CDA1 family)